MMELLRDAIKKYYTSTRISAPPEIEKREFGYSKEVGQKIRTRHVSFQSEEELNKFLRAESPFYISYSVGYFKYPSATPMENKVMLGADMVFEFDADEVGVFTEKDVWICDNCNLKGFGYRETCPKCGKPVRMELFPSEEREKKLKEMVHSLINDVLIGELGFSEREVEVNFSGNRGYHIHLRSDVVRELDKDARIELAEYITGQSIDPRYLFSEPIRCGKEFCIRGPKPTDKGWPGRIARAVYEIIKEGREELLKEVGVNPSEIRNYHLYIERGEWPAPQRYPLRVWIELARRMAPLRGYTIDTSTTVDIHRLIRLPDSIHGSTGLSAKRVSSLSTFDPYRDAVVLPSVEVTVKVDISPSFRMKRREFGPFKNEVVELPLYVAYYLIGRGVAQWRLTSSA